MNQLTSIAAWSVSGVLLLSWLAPWAVFAVALFVVGRAVYLDDPSEAA